jgi:hypothetical protein
MPHSFRLMLCALIGASLLGCDDRDEGAIRVQRVPKQPGSTTMPVLASAGGMNAADIKPPPASPSEPHWTVPAGWKALPASQMRFAAFQISPDHPEVQLTVIPLGSQDVLANIVRWQGQLKLPPSTEADLPRLLQRIQVAGHPIDLVDLTAPETESPRQRILGAILSHGDRDWFFKLMGPVDVVAAQKDNFDAFIRSIHFDHGDDAHAPTAAAPAPPLPPQAQQLPAGHPPTGGGVPANTATSPQISYAAPAGWTQQPPLPLRVVSFTAGDGTDVIVSQLSSTGSGSYLDNVNRWRGQVGLPPIKEGDPQPSKPVIVGGIDGALFDLTGPSEQPPVRRMLLAWVPRGDQWWFIKMVGPQAVVNQQEANFNSFVQSIKFDTGATR